MSNRPNLRSSMRKTPLTIEKIKTPARIRMHHHVGDLAGCGTIRVMIPSMLLNNYYSKNYQFEVMYNNRYVPHPVTYDGCALVTFQRLATKQQLELIKSFRMMNPGKKVIYEIDDDLTEIPSWNFASKFYNENKRYTQDIMRSVDGIICSTEHLRSSLLRYNSNIRVSENHLPKFIWGDVVPQPENTGRIRIMYAGSHNHFDRNSDKGDFSKELIDFVGGTIDKYQWIFVGGIPHSLKGNDKIINHFWQPVLQYPGFLKSMNPDIVLAPLDDNHFNRCKSNIKALESVAIGAPLVSSHIKPYENLPCTARSTEEFISLIEMLASDYDKRYNTWKEQYNILSDQLFWEDNDSKNLLHYVNQHLKLIGKEL